MKRNKIKIARDASVLKIHWVFCFSCNVVAVACILVEDFHCFNISDFFRKKNPLEPWQCCTIVEQATPQTLHPRLLLQKNISSYRTSIYTTPG
jgi:hypothetical protein